MLIKKLILSLFIMIFSKAAFSEDLHKMVSLNLENEGRAKGKGVKIAVIETFLRERDFFDNPIKEGIKEIILCQTCKIAHHFSLTTNHALAITSVLLDPQSGICPEASVDLYFFNPHTGSVSDLFRELSYKEYDVISCSFMVEAFKEVRHGICEYLKKKEALFILSSGNQNAQKDLRFIEKLIDEDLETKLIFACSMNQNYEKSLFSNYGSAGYEDMFLYAPGEMRLPQVNKNGELGVEFLRGTSIAAPFIAGIAALIKQKFPYMKASELKEILLDSAFKPEDNTDWGYGIVRIPAILGPETSLLKEDFQEKNDHIAPRIHGFDRNVQPIFEFQVSHNKLHFPPFVSQKKCTFFMRMEEIDTGDLLLRPHPFLEKMNAPLLRAQLFKEDGKELFFQDSLATSCWSYETIGYRGDRRKVLAPRNFVLPEIIQAKKHAQHGIFSFVKTPVLNALTFHWLLPKEDACFARGMLKQTQNAQQFSQRLARSYLGNSICFSLFRRILNTPNAIRFLK